VTPPWIVAGFALITGALAPTVPARLTASDHTDATTKCKIGGWDGRIHTRPSATEAVRNRAPVALVGCSPVTVSTSAAPGADFSTRHTYAWEPNPQMGGTLDDSIAGQDIHAAVNQALQTHGWTNVSVEIIENSGHYVADEQPTALAALIERYASM
jgi:hypothetical protein